MGMVLVAGVWPAVGGPGLAARPALAAALMQARPFASASISLCLRAALRRKGLYPMTKERVCLFPSKNFKPDLSLVCSVWDDVNKRENQGIFFYPWLSYHTPDDLIFLNLRPASV